MRITKRSAAPEAPGITATARVDRRTDAVLARLRPGEIAVIDHPDLDRATAQRLVDLTPALVVNASAFVTGRHPARGAALLLAAGIRLLDRAGTDVFAGVRDGREVRVHDGVVHVGDVALGRGTELTDELLAEHTDAAAARMAAQLVTVTHNATEVLRSEEDLVLHGTGTPRLQTQLRGRDVLVVADGPDLASELRGIRPWLRHQQVVVIAVDRAADVLAEHGIRADVVVLSAGDSGSSARALRAAHDVVVLGAAAADHEALERMGITALSLDTAVAGVDAAVLLASVSEARLVVTAGQHADLADLLDRRDAAASALVARLRAGPQLVDARVLPHLWTGSVRSWHLWLVLLVGVLAVVAAIAVTPVGRAWLDVDLRDLTDSIRGLFR